ncbi:MAG: DUF4416 family protein [Calditrichaeota bacterium]|nr:DUF4416 family protein [Calditrichota bacterium]
MEPLPPPMTKLICGVLFTKENLLDDARQLMIEKFGDIDFESGIFPFEVSDYYKPEMGWPIFRIFWSFAPLIAPSKLAEIKLTCNELENSIAVAGKRKVNLDPGYLDYDKIVLASAKYNWQKIYLDKGIYADPTLRYEKGHYHPFPWSFPDFKDGQYEKVFLRIRELYKQQRKQK